MSAALSRLCVSLLLGLSSSIASAQPAPRLPSTAPTAEVQPKTLERALTWRDTSYTARLDATRAASTVVLLDGRGRTVWQASIPSTALAFVETLELNANILEARGHREILELSFTGISANDEAARYRLVLHTGSRGAIETLWQGREAANEPGDSLVVQDLNGDGTDELVLFAKSPQVPFCGVERAPLFPRVFDARAGAFRPASLRPPIPANARSATLRASAPPRRFQNDTTLEGVSANDDRISARSYGRAPRALSDGASAEAWRLPASATVGAFISATINPYAKLNGVAFERPAGPLPAFDAIIHTSGGETFTIAIPSGTREGFIALPEPVQTECATLAVVDWERSAGALTFAELSFRSSLDEGDLAAVVNAQIIDPYLASGSAVERIRIANLLDTHEAAVVALIDARFDEIPTNTQAPIVEAMLRSDAGRARVLERLARGSLSSSSIAAVGRVLSRERGTSEELYQILTRTNDEDTRVALIRVLSRSVSPEEAKRLLPLLKNHPAASRSDLAFGLGQALFTDIDTLLLALSGNESEDLIILRAIARIGGRSAGRHSAVISDDAIAKLNAAMNHDNGSVARAAYRIAGMIGVSDLRPRLLAAITEDPHGPIRLAALRGLAFYDDHFSEDGPNNGIMLETLEDEDPSMRIAAANILRERQVSETEVDFILNALRKEIWPDAQRSLVVALVRQGRPDIDLRLAEAVAQLEDTALARAALVNWQARQLVPPAAAVLRLEALAQTNDTVHIALIRTTARLQEPAAHEAMVRWLEASEATPRLRASVIEAMGRQRHLGHLPLLTSILANDGGVDARRAAARALAWFEGNRTARAALLDAKENERNPAVLESVEHALRAIQQAEYTRDLLEVDTPPQTAD